MSARAPFVPQRPVSRQYCHQSERNASESQLPHDTSAVPSLQNFNASLDTTSSNSQQLDDHFNDQDCVRKDGAMNHLTLGVNKPLNLSAFTKKKPMQQIATGKSRRSFEDSTVQSCSPRPMLPPQQASHSASLSPFFHNVPEIAPTAGIHVPPAITSKMQAETPPKDFSSNHAHIPDSVLLSGLQMSDRLQMMQGLPSDNSLPFSPLDSAAPVQNREQGSRLLLEELQESVDGDECNENHKMIQYGHRSKEYCNFSVELSGILPSNTNARCGNPLTRAAKRMQEVDQDHDMYNTKRYKMDRVSTLVSRDADSTDHFAVPDDPAHLCEQTLVDHHQGSSLRSPSDARSLAAEDGKSEALYKLLGRDLNAFVEDRVEAYEAAKKKWSECSMEEWKTGAEEVAGKFASVIGYVKEHMSAKLVLYANLHSVVAAQRSALSERERVLVDARDGLVREGGNVVSQNMAGFRGNVGENEAEV
ncbi:uncharacterized protein FIBRA_07593 [Fibroporia radiculosa]|uniref:Extracellular mutant protein 11 C-terminal domain-containing protein n=1 Tax=Fibroporia radiculosa TaxID=599839 RepID=J4I0Z4_9APHY|nr:uncharacterized protein FIBRA_07593 [Fibroporia radiculosa]CCM05377.1 predicted protein [Fibroporia radiculosa]